ncbi:MAG: SRPBCC family protein [Gaiellaceae bacterium]
MTTMTPKAMTTQVYRVYIKATPEAIWDAITKPEWSQKYGYGGSVEYDLRPGGTYRALTSEEMRAVGSPDVAVDGEVVESDPPRRLVQTWRMLMDEEMAGEGFTRLTWEIDATESGVTRLTVSHELEGAPKLAAMVAGGLEEVGAGGGWSWILSDLKSLLETGKPLAA